MIPPLLIRADAGAGIGAGHLLRGLALAQAAQAAGGRAAFLSHGAGPALRARIEAAGFPLTDLAAPHPDPGDLAATLAALGEARGWLVLDGYHFDVIYQAAIRAAGHRLMVVDDTAHQPRYAADLLLNPNLGAERLPYGEAGGTILAGPYYAPLRAEFAAARGSERPVAPVARRVLVTLGGSDPANATPAVIAALARVAGPGLEVRVVAGPLNPHRAALQAGAADFPGQIDLLPAAEDMPALMAWADVAVTAGGGTCWELACLGLPALVLVLAENQRGATALESLGVARVQTADGPHSAESIADSLAPLLAEAAPRAQMRRLGRALVDGRGARRVLAALRDRTTYPDRLALRPAVMADAPLLWQWANDPVARANSFQSAPIPWLTHVDWLAGRLAAPGTRIWVLEASGVPVGQVRYDRLEDGVAQISYIVDPLHRGRGLGTCLLDLTAARAAAELGVPAIQGVTFSHNTASARAFLKAGFTQGAAPPLDGQPRLLFRKVLGDALST